MLTPPMQAPEQYLYNMQKRQLMYKFIPAPPTTSPASIAKESSTSSRKCIRKARKSVRWGSAYTYKSMNSVEDVPIMWYTVSYILYDSCISYNIMQTLTDNNHLFLLYYPQRQDLDVFQREKKKIIRALKHVKGDLTALEGTKYVTRGFECYQSVPFNRRIRKQRQQVVQKVLELQKTNGGAHVAPELLAEASRNESAWAREFALELGAKDAQTNGMGWREFFATTEHMDTEESSDSEASQEGVMSGDELDQMHLDVTDGIVASKSA